MKIWIITALIVIALACLAASASWWMPELLTMVTDNATLIQYLTTGVQLGLWLLAALAGSLGARWALAERESAVQATDAASREAVVKVGNNGNERAGQVRTEQEEDEAPEGLVTLYTSGGVRIIAEGSCLELDESKDWLEPQAEAVDDKDTVELAVHPPAGARTGTSTSTDTPVPFSAPVITTPFNLPADLPDFTGRKDESAAVRRRLRQNGAVAISGIAGMGGIGKTALALHVAQQLAVQGHYPDAQLYIDLKGTEPKPLAPAAALGTLLTALLGPDAERPEDEEALAHLWHAALQDKQALLVLDNAAGPAQVQPLLPDTPTCAVLITSRQRFSLPGAGLLDLNRLKQEEARALLQALAPRLDDATADGIADLCGGLPLALRIAGNYLALNDDFSGSEYTEHLADERGRLAHLRDPDDPELDVAATLSLSVAQLDAGTHWAWSLLALFPTPFDAAAAAALWGEGVTPDGWDPLDEDTTLAWLRILRDRSLVTYDPEADRYHLHDLLHLAASQQLENAGEAEGARKRLAYHYLSVAQAVDREQRYLDLDPEWPHLQAALKCARQNVELFSDMVLALNDYWSARGMARQRADWSRRAAQACAAALRRQDEGVHLGNLGSAYADRGDARRAIEVYGQALPISRRTGDRRLEGTLLGNLGNAYANLGEARRAIRFHKQALAIAQEVGDRRMEGTLLGNLGTACAALGEPRRAIEFLEQGLAIAQEISDRRVEGAHLGSLGLAYADLGDAAQAIDCQKQALAIQREVGDRRGEGNALDSLGRAYADRGEPQRAIDYFEQALEISRAIGDRRSEGADLGNLGLAHASLGDTQRAIDHYEQALSIAQEVGDRRNESACLGNLGRSYVDQGEIQQAMVSYDQALTIAEEIGDRRSEGIWLGSLGQAHAELGDVQQALDYHEQALTIYQEIGDRRSEGNHLASLGLLAQMQGDEDRAHEVWTDALRTFEALKDPNAGRVWHWLAELEGQTA
jgi:tetratricopeptide (TPR) repeat protein